MHIGIVGPIATENIADFLGGDTMHLPPGYAGAPLLATLIGELLSRGHRVSAFTTSKGVPIATDSSIEAGHDRFLIRYCPLRPHSFRPKYGCLGRATDFFRIERAALRAAIESAQPDIVHGHWSYEFGLATIKSGLPHVVTCHDSPSVVLKFTPNAYRFIRYLMGRQCLRQASVVTAVSPYLGDAVQKYCKVPVAVIQNPLPDFILEQSTSVSAQRVSLGGRRRIVMVMNGWSALKNPTPALLAFHKLRSSHYPDLELHLYGADFGPGEIAEQWVRKHGGQYGIHFHGRTVHRELLEQLKMMDLMIHPALEESCPMGIAEALAIGLPVIGGEASGGVSWVIGEGGVKTDVTSPDAIANAVGRLLDSQPTWQKCSNKAIERAVGTFSAKVVADMYEEQYKYALTMSRS